MLGRRGEGSRTEERLKAEDGQKPGGCRQCSLDGPFIVEILKYFHADKPRAAV